MYPPEAVTVLRVIKAAQRLGFSLDEVAALLEAGRHHHRRDGDGLVARSRAKLADIESKMAHLALIRDSLVTALDAGCDDLMGYAESDASPLPFSAFAAIGG